MRSLWGAVSGSKAKAPAKVDVKDAVQHACAQTDPPGQTDAASQTTNTKTIDNMSRMKTAIDALHADVKRLSVLCQRTARDARASREKLSEQILQKIDSRDERTIHIMELLADNLDSLVQQSKDDSTMVSIPSRDESRGQSLASAPFKSDQPSPQRHAPRHLSCRSGPTRCAMPLSISVNDTVRAMGPLKRWRPAMIQNIVCKPGSDNVLSYLTVRFLDSDSSSDMDLIAQIPSGKVSTHIRKM